MCAHGYTNLYNVSTKEKYFSYCYPNSNLTDQALVNLIAVFDKIGYVERIIGKDLYSFNYIDFQILFSKLSWNQHSTFLVRKSVIRSYIEWAVNNGLTSKKFLGAIEDFKTSDLNTRDYYKKYYYKSFPDLSSTIREICDNAFKTGTILSPNRFCMLECIFYLIWLRPKNIEDIFLIKLDDVDFYNKTIIIGGHKYEVSYDILKAAQICMNEVEIEIRTRGKTSKKLKYGESDYLLRGIGVPQLRIELEKTMLVNFNELSNDLPEHSNNRGRVFSNTKVITSSLFADIYNFEKKNNIAYDPSIKTLAASRAIKSAFGSQINGSLLRDYYKWRFAFYGA